MHIVIMPIVCDSVICRRFTKSDGHAGVDVDRFSTPGTCYAGYHYDLNFLTIHGKSRFPGLAVWLQDGRRMPVSIPDGCLLIQAGKQIEWLTNGHIRGGMHEVCARSLIFYLSVLSERPSGQIPGLPLRLSH